MQRLWLLVRPAVRWHFVIVAFAGACSGESTEPVSTLDPKPKSGSAEPRQSGTQRPNAPPELLEGQVEVDHCAGLPRVRGVLRTPETPLGQNQTTSECDGLAQGFLLENVSDEAVEITHMEVTPDAFRIEHAALPFAIAAGERARVAVGFKSQFESAERGTLWVFMPEGCAEIEVHGGATDQGVFTYSDWLIDFGTVAPGATVQRKFTVLYQHGIADEQASFGPCRGGGVTLIDAPEAFEPTSCEPVDFTVRLVAPTEPGPFNASLSCSASFRSGRRTVDGGRAIRIFATVQ